MNPQNLPKIVTRDEWLTARKALLAKEKEATRQRDALNAQRRQLPMVCIEKDYLFDGEKGRVHLAELFEGQRQLIIYHFMFGPDWEKGCSACTALCDESSDGRLRHLHSRDTTMAVVARAPLDKLTAYKRARGWTFPWYSSFGSDFNYDFGVTLDEKVAPLEYAYRTKAEHEKAGTAYWFEGEQPIELPGFSCFLRDGENVYHTYSTFSRGGEVAITAYQFLDLTALGRQETWEEPKGRVEHPYPPMPNFAPERAGEK